MQFQVPQFIETEDKIIGPLSLRQFAYVGAGGVLSGLIYFVAQLWLWVIASVIIFGIVFALAFIKIEGRPFVNVILSAFHFYWRPQTYVWQAEHPTVSLGEKRQETDAGKSALEEILASSSAKARSVFAHPQAAARPAGRFEAKPEPITRATASSGSALHKSWEGVQTGAAFAKKNSDKQFLEKKMAERYQIFQRISGERNAAKRIDYR